MAPRSKRSDLNPSPVDFRSDLLYGAPMTKLEKIEQEIASLDPKDVRKLADWLDEYKSDLWDRQIEADVKAGKLDKLAENALKEIAAGRVRPL